MLKPLIQARRAALAMTLVLALPALSQADEPQDDQTAVRTTMQAFMAALSRDDLAQFHRITCEDFYAFDGGKVFTRDQIFDVIKKAQAGGTTFVWRVIEPKIHVDGHTAWMTYINDGSVATPQGKKPVKWTESAVFGQAPAGWCLRFVHSSRMASG